MNGESWASPVLDTIKQPSSQSLVTHGAGSLTRCTQQSRCKRHTLPDSRTGSARLAPTAQGTSPTKATGRRVTTSFGNQRSCCVPKRRRLALCPLRACRNGLPDGRRQCAKGIPNATPAADWRNHPTRTHTLPSRYLSLLFATGPLADRSPAHQRLPAPSCCCCSSRSSTRLLYIRTQ